MTDSDCDSEQYAQRLLLHLGSSVKEYTLSNRGPVSREELEAQKAAIVKRLGILQANDTTTRTAYEVGGEL